MMEMILESNQSLLAERVVELENKVAFLLTWLKIPVNTDFKNSSSVNQVFGGYPSSSSEKKSLEPPGPPKTSQENRDRPRLSPEVGHGQKWVGGGEGNFQCPICGIRFRTKLSLAYHKMKLKHRHRHRHQRQRSQNEEIVETDNYNEKENQVEDPDEGQQSKNDDLDDTDNGPTSPSPPPSPLEADNDNDQIEIEKDNVCLKTRRTRSKPEVKNKVETGDDGEEGNYLCQVCGMRFLTFSNFEYHKLKMNHRIRKNQKGKATCEHCGFVAKCMGKLKLHLIKHTKERSFLCNLCGKGLKSDYTLKKHIETMHQIEGKNWQCPHCQSWHKTEVSLRLHIELHKGKKDEMCPHCGKIYVNLIRHIKEVHDNVRAFECHLCPYKFKKKGHLQRHLESHAKGENRRIKSYHVERPEVNAKRKCVKKIARFEGNGSGGGEDTSVGVGVTMPTEPKPITTVITESL